MCGKLFVVLLGDVMVNVARTPLMNEKTVLCSYHMELLGVFNFVNGSDWPLYVFVKYGCVTDVISGKRSTSVLPRIPTRTRQAWGEGVIKAGA